jgi:hypothetical protein
MAGKVESPAPPRGWPVVAIAWLVGLVMGLALAPLVPWGGSAQLFAPPHPEGTRLTPSATPTGPAAPPSATPGPALSPPMPPTPIPSPTATPSPTVTPSPTPRVTPPPPGAVFGLAWFHKPPDDDATAEQIANAHRYIHLTGPADLAFRAELRAAGYSGPIYDYVTAYAVEGPGPYKNAAAPCEAGYTPYDDQMAWFEDDFCTYIHPNESWFLHNGAGERLVYDYFGTGHWNYFMNPADPGWRAFSYSRLRHARDVWEYDGLWLDNLDFDLNRLVRELPNSDGAVREYATDEAWRDGMRGWLAGLRSAVGSWPIWANLIGERDSPTAWEPYAPYLDGAMEESYAVRWVEDWLPRATWEVQQARAARWLAAGKGLVLVGQGPRDDADRMRFTLASYLLVAEGDQAFYRYTRFDSYYHGLWLYPEFDTARALGAPSGPRQEIAPGVWRRPFANGYVEVDADRHTGRLVLTGP